LSALYQKLYLVHHPQMSQKRILVKMSLDQYRDEVYTLKYKLSQESIIMKATAKDLRFHSKELLSTVNRGEEIIITYRGKPCAKLVPYDELKSDKKTNLFGMWKDNNLIKDVDNYVRNLRKSRF
jgi:prevent-host-death family protein